MTVTRVGLNSNEAYLAKLNGEAEAQAIHCTWFDTRKKLTKGSFTASSLEPVPVEG